MSLDASTRNHDRGTFLSASTWPDGLRFVLHIRLPLVGSAGRGPNRNCATSSHRVRFPPHLNRLRTSPSSTNPCIMNPTPQNSPNQREPVGAGLAFPINPATSPIIPPKVSPIPSLPGTTNGPDRRRTLLEAVQPPMDLASRKPTAPRPREPQRGAQQPVEPLSHSTPCYFP